MKSLSSLSCAVILTGLFLVFASDCSSPASSDDDSPKKQIVWVASELDVFCRECPTDDLQELKKLVEREPGNLRAKLWLSRLCIKHYQFPEAIAEAEKVIARGEFPDHANALIALAYIQDWRFPDKEVVPGENLTVIGKSMDFLDKVMKHNPDYLFARILKAYVLANTEREMEGMLLMKDIIKEHPDRLDALLWRGNLYYESLGWYTTTLGDYLAIRDHDSDAYVQLGRVYSALAIKSAMEVQEEDKVNSYMKNAVNSSLKAIDLQPDNYIPYERIGETISLGGDGNNEQVIRWYTKSIERRSTVKGHLLRGEIYYYANRMEEARKDVLTVLENITEDKTEFLSHHISMYIDSKKYDYALMWMDEAIKRDERNGDFHYLRGTVDEAMGKPDEARADYRKAVELEAKTFLKQAREHLRLLDNSPGETKTPEAPSAQQ